MSTDQAHGDEEIPPRSTSTPISENAARFRTVDIKNRGNIIFSTSGDANSAHSATQSGDTNSASVSDKNSAKIVSGAISDAGTATQTGKTLESGTGNLENSQAAGTSGSINLKVISSKRVPAMIKPPKTVATPEIPAEADATPSSIYESMYLGC
jgi:hypothetical protein